MTAEARRWSEHDLGNRFDLGPPHDELTQLAATFDSMLARLEANLRREQRVTAEISHELRTPLAAIAAEAELALRRPRADERYREALAGIERRARQLAEIVETLMVAARSQTLLSDETADAGEAARRAIDGSSSATTRGHDRSRARAARDVRVQASLAAASQVLSPLLENACRYGASPISVSIGAENGSVSYEVRDRGPGIPAGRARPRLRAGCSGRSREYRRSGSRRRPRLGTLPSPGTHPRGQRRRRREWRRCARAGDTPARARSVAPICPAARAPRARRSGAVQNSVPAVRSGSGALRKAGGHELTLCRNGGSQHSGPSQLWSHAAEQGPPGHDLLLGDQDHVHDDRRDRRRLRQRHTSASV